MATSIKLKKSSISGRIPSTSDLDYGELAINYADGILYFKNSSNQVGSVNARSLGVDSTATFSIIDSAYIESRVGSTSNIAEGTNLYYTSTRADSDAKNAITISDAGGDGSLSYNSTTGALTYTGPSASEVRSHFSAAGDITYNSSTGQFSLDVESVYTADNFDSDYISAKDSANTAVERNKHDATTKNFSVTVASKTADHVYNGTGSGSGYVIDGTQSPIVQLQIGRTYRFTLSSSDMSSHPFRFYYDAGKTTQYTTNVTTTSTYAEIEITESTPTVLHYQCSAHGYMGHAFVIGTRNLTGFNTDNLSEGSSNVYYSNTRVETLVDSSYVQSRQINNPSGVDSSATIDLIDSAYVQERTRIGLDDIDFGSKKILYSNVYSQTSDLPSASTYHGMFAHVHSTGKGYFAHGGNWIELANASQLFSGAYADLTGKPVLIDSGLTTSLIDSSYVQARQIQYTNDDFADSAFVTSQINNLIDAAPGALNTLNELAAAIGDDANFSTTVTNSIATKLTSAQATNLVDSAYVQARQINNPSGVDSSATIDLIDSAYVQLRQINNPSGVDSAATIALVDSAYIQARFGTLRESNNSLVLSGSIIPETDSAFSLGTAQKKFKDLHLSGGTVFLDNLALSADPVTQTINIGQLDSIGVVNVVGVIATVDSAGVSAIVDSAFLEARLGDFVSETELTSKNFTTFDSADATSVIDSGYINSLNANAGALNGQNGAHYLNYNNFTNTPEAGIDYGTVVASATSAIGILDILVSQATVDYGTLSSPGSLKSNYGTL